LPAWLLARKRINGTPGFFIIIVIIIIIIIIYACIILFMPFYYIRMQLYVSERTQILASLEQKLAVASGAEEGEVLPDAPHQTMPAASEHFRQKEKEEEKESRHSTPSASPSPVPLPFDAERSKTESSLSLSAGGTPARPPSLPIKQSHRLVALPLECFRGRQCLQGPLRWRRPYSPSSAAP
jgi:hypothetical protein